MITTRSFGQEYTWESSGTISLDGGGFGEEPEIPAPGVLALFGIANKDGMEAAKLFATSHGGYLSINNKDAKLAVGLGALSDGGGLSLYDNDRTKTFSAP